MKKVVTASLLLLTIVSIGFTSTVEGTVKYVKVRASDGLIYCEINGTIQGTRPSSASNTEYYMINSSNSSIVNRQLATLLTAKASGSNVKIYGSESCNAWNDGEDINTISMR